MINQTFASAKRAVVFFGAMAAVVGALSLGAQFQPGPDGSSQAVAMAKLRGGQQAETQIAAVDARQRGYSQVKRNIPGTQQARAEGGATSAVR